MIKRLHHIGIAVDNLEEGLKIYESILGSKPLLIQDIPVKQARVALFKLGEDVEVELLSATGPECDINEFIDKHGQGIHHIALEVDDINAEMKGMEEKGFKLTDKVPRKGLAGQVGWFDVDSVKGAMIELVQPDH